MNDVPKIARVRHELRRRTASIAHVERLAPMLVRIRLAGDELRGFTSLGFDDHVKFFVPGGEARDFTPRSFDAVAGELTIDFFLHGHGPAALWAAQAAAGQEVIVGGPRGSAVISMEGIDSHLLIGDETALPAIERRLEELPADTRALVVVEIESGNEQALSSRAALQVVWVRRTGSPEAPGDQLIQALRALQFSNERCFAWAATETQAVRAIRGYLTQERGFDKKWVKAAGYWQRGAAGTHVVVED
jgi:NADPH-dependent ferric siderophore reductase